ncbi:unnamed protein product [Phytophthora lilii]|uniref:Unnamed protein product n=1 Tax=Phytophthora lilii TaxID=2077276 RepID=A0A9W6XBG5_9STRA|nr:unnamed protein product [Phytophthora lilii]
MEFPLLEDEEMKSTEFDETAEDWGAISETSRQLYRIPLQYEYEGGDNYDVRECFAVYYEIIIKLLFEQKKKCVTVTGACFDFSRHNLLC